MERTNNAMATNLPNTICPPPLFYRGSPKASNEKKNPETQLDLRQCRQHSTVYDPAATSLHWAALVGEASSLATKYSGRGVGEVGGEKTLSCTCAGTKHRHSSTPLPLLEALARTILSSSSETRKQDEILPQDRQDTLRQAEATSQGKQVTIKEKPELLGFKSSHRKSSSFVRECCVEDNARNTVNRGRNPSNRNTANKKGRKSWHSSNPNLRPNSVRGRSSNRHSPTASNVPLRSPPRQRRLDSRQSRSRTPPSPSSPRKSPLLQAGKDASTQTQRADLEKLAPLVTLMDEIGFPLDQDLHSRPATTGRQLQGVDDLALDFSSSPTAYHAGIRLGAYHLPLKHERDELLTVKDPGQTRSLAEVAAAVSQSSSDSTAASTPAQTHPDLRQPPLDLTTVTAVSQPPTSESSSQKAGPESSSADQANPDDMKVERTPAHTPADSVDIFVPTSCADQSEESDGDSASHLLNLVTLEEQILSTSNATNIDSVASSSDKDAWKLVDQSRRSQDRETESSAEAVMTELEEYTDDFESESD